MLGRQFPTLETMLGDSAEELLAFTAFPPSHWTKIWPTTRWSGSTRRSNAARRRGVFPNPDALGRLAGAVLVKTHDEGQVSHRRYLSEGSMACSPRRSGRWRQPAHAGIDSRR
jgi:putative transposase